ncbi:hypothetical protein F383_29626 [Gossypium arboreum]|uniref:Uncharacterized protein n=1 Tax=Gossypium arboreum TaxID=29729 RepID=A0A0B0PGT9_GOSAR|nr:hypothetical protein F383_29626 [Gossypium arboreum]
MHIYLFISNIYTYLIFQIN